MNAAPAEVPATCSPVALRRPNGLCHRCTADGRGEAQLVAASHEDTVGFLDCLQILFVLARFAVRYVQNPSSRNAEPVKVALVSPPGVAQLRSGGNDNDACSRAAADLDVAF